MGGIEPAREYLLQAINSGRRRRDGEQGAARDPRSRDLRRRRPGRRAGLLRGRGGRRDPDHPAAARLARRRPRAADHGHRQRHDQLHPRPHGHRGRRARATCSPTRSASATPRPTRRPTSKATTPRRRPRSSRASPSTRRCRSRPCTARASRGIDKATMDAARHAGYVIKLLAVCERLDAATRMPRHPSRSRCASTRR